jgi:hypothetical protein
MVALGRGLGGKEGDQRPGPPGTHQTTIPNPAAATVTAQPPAAASGPRIAGRPRSRSGTPAATIPPTCSGDADQFAWSGVGAMRGRAHGHDVSRRARAAAPRSASRRAARSHRVRWPARRTSGRAASDRPATAASRWRKPCPLLVVTNGTNGGSSRSVQPFSRSRSRAPARSNHGVPPADSAHSWTTAGTARTATRRPGRCRAAPRTTWTRR